MSNLLHQLGLYLHLARASQHRRRPMVRDRILVLAGTIAVQLNLWQVSAYCRHLILQNNPRHLLRHWSTIADALKDDEFQGHLKQLQRRYPRERAEQMLASLGVEMARERDAYYSDLEYAAAILGTTPEQLDELFGEAPD